MRKMVGIIKERYTQFLVWLGAEPPSGYEHLIPKEIPITRRKTEITLGAFYEKLYIPFMVWLGAQPPPGYEHPFITKSNRFLSQNYTYGFDLSRLWPLSLVGSSLEVFRNTLSISQLRKRIVFTILILVVYRVIVHIPAAELNQQELNKIFEENLVLGLVNIYTGDGLANFSVLAVGIFPFILASIFVSVLLPLIPRLQELEREGEQGHEEIRRITKYLGALLTLLFGAIYITVLNRRGVFLLEEVSVFTPASIIAQAAVVFTFTATGVFVDWLADRITEQGIGNGKNILLVGNLTVTIPNFVSQMLASGVAYWELFIFICSVFLTIIFIIPLILGQRRIPVQYGKRVRGAKVYGGQSSHIPLKVIPRPVEVFILAWSLTVLLAVFANWAEMQLTGWISPIIVSSLPTFSVASWYFQGLFFLLICSLAMYYIQVDHAKMNLAQKLQVQGGFVPGKRPGKLTEDYLKATHLRITFCSVLLLAIVAISPFLLYQLTNLKSFLYQISTSTSIFFHSNLMLLIVIIIDTLNQFKAQYLLGKYGGFIS